MFVSIRCEFRVSRVLWGLFFWWYLYIICIYTHFWSLKIVLYDMQHLIFCNIVWSVWKWLNKYWSHVLLLGRCFIFMFIPCHCNLNIFFKKKNSFSSKFCEGPHGRRVWCLKAGRLWSNEEWRRLKRQNLIDLKSNNVAELAINKSRQVDNNQPFLGGRLPRRLAHKRAQTSRRSKFSGSHTNHRVVSQRPVFLPNIWCRLAWSVY